jgi:5,10-methylenetetrahydromethanopterin reductase
MPDLWTLAVSSPTRTARFAERAEAAGWAGLAVVDSQHLSGDSYVALALAAQATDRLGLSTGVTNPVTRHPAVTAAAIASIHAVSGGRAALGIGRGDSALAHLGRAPARVAPFERYLVALQSYLRGDAVAFDALDFHERMAPPVAALGLADTPSTSRLHWLDPTLPKVPVEVAATGPRVIAAAARHADRVVFALGADPERIGWGIEQARAARRDAGLPEDGLAFGAYVNLVCHPDVETARQLVAGGLTTFARFAVMHGRTQGPVTAEQDAVLQRIHDAYDMRKHTRADTAHTATLTPAFVDRYAIVGPPDVCLERIATLGALGLDKLVLIGPTAGASREEAARSADLLAAEVLPVAASAR